MTLPAKKDRPQHPNNAQGMRWARKHTKAVRMLSDGYSNKEVAEKLGVSYFTVKSWFRKPYFRSCVEERFARQHVALRSGRIKALSEILEDLYAEGMEKINKDELKDLDIDTILDKIAKFAKSLRDEQAAELPDYGKDNTFVDNRKITVNQILDKIEKNGGDIRAARNSIRDICDELIDNESQIS